MRNRLAGLLSLLVLGVPLCASGMSDDGAIQIAITSPPPSSPEGHSGWSGVDERPREDVANMSQIVTALAVDPFDQIWAGTSSGRLGVRNVSTGRWSWFPSGRPAMFDPVTAIAFDRIGRVWVGRTYNGVSVFNGKAWHAYGLLDGPLGEHVYDIQLAPDTGDVWLATNRGLSRYRESDHTWSYITRGDGLPSDDIVALAFTRDARLIAATADSGIAIADKGDDYAKWTNVRVDRDVRGEASGDGISSDWCNDVAADADGNVYVATIAGLSFSRDAGQTWRFVRGADYLARARNATQPPELPDSPEAGVIGEEYVASVAINARGELLLGHRRECDATVRNAADFSVLRSPGIRSKRAYCVASAAGGASYFGTYGFGIIDQDGLFLGPDAPDEDVEADDRIRFAAGAPSKPLPVPARDAERLVQHFHALLDRPAADKMGTFLTTDWLTGGDSIARYGTHLVALPWYGGLIGDGFGHDIRVGPHAKPARGGKGLEGPYTYYDKLDSADPRHLIHPLNGRRQQGEWNDASWQESRYPPEYEGPDLWVQVTTPPGWHRVSLYVINQDPRHRTNFSRDYLLELRRQSDKVDPPRRRTTADLALPDWNVPVACESLPVVARARAKAPAFTEGVYFQFTIDGGTWWVKLVRNASPCTKLSGVFVDSFTEAPPQSGWYKPKLAPSTTYTLTDAEWRDPSLAAAVKLCQRLDASRRRSADIDTAARIAAYRVLHRDGLAADLLQTVRWPTPIQTPGDRLAVARGANAMRAHMDVRHVESCVESTCRRLVDEWGDPLMRRWLREQVDEVLLRVRLAVPNAGTFGGRF